MVRVPGTCQHQRSPGTGCLSSHSWPHNTLPAPQTLARSRQPRSFHQSCALSQLSLGDIATKQQDKLASGDRATSAKHCSTSYSLCSEDCSACGRPLSGKALQWWSKLDRHSHQHRHMRLKQCSPTAQSTSNGAGITGHKRKASSAVQAGKQADSGSKLLRDSDISSLTDNDSDQPPEAGVVSEAPVTHVQPPSGNSTSSKASASASNSSAAYASPRTVLFPAKEQGNIKDSWQTLMRWSKVFKKDQNGMHVLDKTEKVVVFGGGSFGTAMGVALARQRSTLSVALLLRDAYVCRDINNTHTNTRYLPVSAPLLTLYLRGCLCKRLYCVVLADAWTLLQIHDKYVPSADTYLVCQQLCSEYTSAECRRCILSRCIALLNSCLQ